MRDPRHTNPAYDFRFYYGDPMQIARQRLGFALRMCAMTRRRNGAASLSDRLDLADANRRMWVARQIVAGEALEAET